MKIRHMIYILLFPVFCIGFVVGFLYRIYYSGFFKGYNFTHIHEETRINNIVDEYIKKCSFLNKEEQNANIS